MMVTSVIEYILNLLTDFENIFTPGISQELKIEELNENDVITTSVSSFVDSDVLEFNENLQEVSRILTLISVELNTPLIPLNPLSNSASIIFNQDPFFSRLNNFMIPSSEVIFTLLNKRLSVQINDINSYKNMCSNVPFLQILDNFSFFMHYLFSYCLRIDDMSFTDQSVQLDKKLYSDFVLIVQKYPYICDFSKRYEYFKEIVAFKKTNVNKSNLLLMNWCEDYIKFRNELKLFKKGIPLNHSYDFESLKLKFDLLNDHILIIENNHLSKMEISLNQMSNNQRSV